MMFLIRRRVNGCIVKYNKIRSSLDWILDSWQPLQGFESESRRFQNQDRHYKVVEALARRVGRYNKAVEACTWFRMHGNRYEVVEALVLEDLRRPLQGPGSAYTSFSERRWIICKNWIHCGQISSRSPSLQ